MDNFKVMAIMVNHRVSKAPKLQEVLTEYGCIIKMRLGLHEAGDACSNEGMIILQLHNDSDEIHKLTKALKELEGVRAGIVEI